MGEHFIFLDMGGGILCLFIKNNNRGTFDFLGQGGGLVFFCRPSFSLQPEKTGYFFQQLESRIIFGGQNESLFCNHIEYIFYNHWYMNGKLQFHQFSIIRILRSFIKIQLTRDKIWKGFIPCVK